MMTPEHGEDGGRLHFHALVEVPAGQMVGDLYSDEEYSTKEHRMKVTMHNTFFEDRFGLCDFAEIDSAGLKDTLSYMLKYLAKEGGRIIYSRGIPSEYYLELPDCWVVAEYQDFVPHFVFRDWLSALIDKFDRKHMTHVRDNIVSRVNDRYATAILLSRELKKEAI